MTKYRSGSVRSAMSNATAMHKQHVSTVSLNDSQSFEEGHTTIIEQNSDEDMEMKRAGSDIDSIGNFNDFSPINIKGGKKRIETQMRVGSSETSYFEKVNEFDDKSGLIEPESLVMG